MRHRFSEFEAMRNDLKATYATYGITVPTMPPKKIIVQADDTDFIKERTHGLTIFCQAIIASPWLRFDRTWIDFMRTGGGDSGKAGSVGESMLLLSYAQLEPPGNAYARMNEFKDELLLVERRLLALITAAKSMQAAQAELAKSNDSVATALTEWVDVEVNNARLMGGDSGSGGSLIKNPYRVKTTATAVSNFQTAKAKMNEGSALQSGVLLIVALEHELSRIESFRELFVAHDKLYSEIDTLALKEQKMRGSKDAGRKRDDIAELSKQVLDKRNLLTMFYKGLFHYSMPMNVRQRAINLRMCFNMMVAQHQVTSSENMMLASSYFEEMHASPAACASDASAVLDLLGMKTLDFTAGEEPSSILGAQPPATLEMWDEALAKNAKGFAPALHNNSSVNTKATSGNYDYVAPSATSDSAPPKGGRDGYPNRAVARSNSPPPAAPSAPPPPVPAPAPVLQGGRGAMPGLLGRRSGAPAPPPTANSSTMEEVSEEVYYGKATSPSPPAAAEPEPTPAPAPVAVPPAQMKAPSAKAKSLLDDLMGGGDDSAPAPKKASDNLWD